MPHPSSKKMTLLLSGKDIILSKGFAATSVEEICDATSVTKGSFFHYFKSKVDYGLQLLDTIWEPMHRMQAADLKEEDRPLQHLYANIDFAKSFIQADARLMGILMQELSETEPSVANKGHGFFREWTDHMLELVSEAKRQYAPDADFDPGEVMAFIIATIEGIPVIAQRLGPGHVEPTISHLKQYLDILFRITR